MKEVETNCPPPLPPSCGFSPQGTSRELALFLHIYRNWIGVGSWNWDGEYCKTWDEVLEVIDQCHHRIRVACSDPKDLPPNAKKTLTMLESLGEQCMRRKKYYDF